jgi:hypothetical protein
VMGDGDLSFGRSHGDDAVRRAEVDADTHGYPHGDVKRTCLSAAPELRSNVASSEMGRGARRRRRTGVYLQDAGRQVRFARNAPRRGDGRPKAEAAGECVPWNVSANRSAVRTAFRNDAQTRMKPGAVTPPTLRGREVTKQSRSNLLLV